VEFEEIYAEFQPKILNYLSRLMRRNEAEDTAQEVFTKVSRGLDSFKGQSRLSTWIYRIATNTAIDKLRTPAYKHATGHTSLEDNPGVENREYHLNNYANRNDHRPESHPQRNE
jgi:RNA polymerase sigma-70 factor (ECF subfamily)